MFKKTFKSTEQTNSPAVIVDGKLVLSFPEAEIPVVWKMDLDDARACALEVHEDKKKKLFSLLFKQEGKQDSIIADFAEKNNAVNALMAVSMTLQNAHGKIRPSSGIPTNLNDKIMTELSQKQASGGSLSGTILAVALVFILLMIWVLSATPSAKNMTDPASGVSETSDPASGDSGVPMSADEFLSNTP